MFRKKVLLACCAFAFGLGLTATAAAACNNACRLRCERDHRLCNPATDCELQYIRCYQSCGCALP
ncbi:hypothetical protein ABIE09_003872 [Lysobacter enzymogenes]|jgi:hypothetical protein|uniref:hypothetical protein n=1 Tax=Lysobacter enzymogenes TaxID=69 RepID=UPI0008967593|nr:hypothetical protein [Lysobacter enzymogenes]SDW49223.1 hypothetical protein SAMN05421681_10227 [Lysobacter enzymogenes]